MSPQAPPSESRSLRKKRLFNMGAAYAMGTFNDNFFKQAALCLAALAGLEWIQGVATVFFALPFVLFSAWGGWLADAFPKKRVIVRSKYVELAAMLLGIFVLCATGFVSHWWGMVAVVFLMGLQSTFFSPALNGAIPENFPAAEVPKVNAWLKLATTATILLGIALAGLVLELPAPSFMRPWLPQGHLPFGRVAVGAFAALVSLVGIAAAYGIRQNPPKPPALNPPFPWLGPKDSVLHAVECKNKDAPLFLALAGEAFFYGVSAFVLLCIPNLGVRLGFSLTLSSLFSAVLAVGICVGSVLAGRYEAGVWRRFMLPSGAGMALGLVAAAFAPKLPSPLQLPWLFVSFTLAGVFGGLYLIPLVSFIQIRPAAKEKGKILGISNFASFLAILLSGLVFSLLGFLPPALLLAFAGFGIFAFLAWAQKQLHHLPEKTLADTRGNFLGVLVRLGLGLRYKISVYGMEDIPAPTPSAPILFLPNHPALVDPINVYSLLAGVSPRPLADENQTRGLLGRLASKLAGAVRIPDIRKKGFEGKSALDAGMKAIAHALHNGDSVLLYPSGHLYRSKRETIGGSSGTAEILRNHPGLRVVLVRTTGLWGSGFSYAGRGRAPSLLKQLLRGVVTLLANFIFFTPRREVKVEFVEPADLPRCGDKLVLNPWLEAFYAEAERPAMAVPRFFWQGNTPYALAEFVERGATQGEISVPPAVREAVYMAVREVAQLPAEHPLEEATRLSADIGMDSLGLMELGPRLEAVQGFAVPSLVSIVTVGDCLAAAAGKLGEEVLKGGVPEGWFAPASNETLLLSGEGASNIPEAFFALVRKAPGEPLCAERNSLRSRRDILTAALAFSHVLRPLQGQRIGVMLPAAPAVAVVWLAAMLAGKTPVFLNWTVGETNLRHCVALGEIQHVLTASALLDKLKRQGFAPQNIPVQWQPLEKMAKSLSFAQKIGSAFKARFLRSLEGFPIPEVAAVLFTSGSEALPKAVPLNHRNLMANAKDAMEALRVTRRDTILAMLPTFHSFGLLVDIVLPLSLGLRAAYYPNPTEPGPLVAMVKDFKLSLLASPPTFLAALLERAQGTDALASMRFAFVGAEKCPEHVYESFARQCPDAALCEGYGITECSPAISVNRPWDVLPGSIGHPLESVETAIVREEDSRILGLASTDETGMLLVRGPNIFDGYLGDVPSPFVAFEDKMWYRTGDLVSQDNTGRLFFQGRLKRFVKIGGEMISLPQIEETLLAAFSGRADSPADGPSLAVEASPEEAGLEIVVFSPMKLSAKEVNAALRSAGLSALYSIRRLVHLPTIPLLGSGKTNYRELKALLKKPV
ncbi:MAG: MFS transporter [Cystobacterineae bacterium]|nr:MFS transporter [Cystobacterineae bacterium]